MSLLLKSNFPVVYLTQTDLKQIVTDVAFYLHNWENLAQFPIEDSKVCSNLQAYYWSKSEQLSPPLTGHNDGNARHVHSNIHPKPRFVKETISKNSYSQAVLICYSSNSTKQRSKQKSTANRKLAEQCTPRRCNTVLD